MRWLFGEKIKGKGGQRKVLKKHIAFDLMEVF